MEREREREEGCYWVLLGAAHVPACMPTANSRSECSLATYSGVHTRCREEEGGGGRGEKEGGGEGGCGHQAKEDLKAHQRALGEPYRRAILLLHLD